MPMLCLVVIALQAYLHVRILYTYIYIYVLYMYICRSIRNTCAIYNCVDTHYVKNQYTHTPFWRHYKRSSEAQSSSSGARSCTAPARARGQDSPESITSCTPSLGSSYHVKVLRAYVCMCSVYTYVCLPACKHVCMYVSMYLSVNV